MNELCRDIPNLNKNPLHYVFENIGLRHREDTLWLEFGVYNGETINYISRFTRDRVYGFDSFEGLPETWRDGFEKGVFTLNGTLPAVNENVVLVKGLFRDTLSTFLSSENKKVSFVHIDCDLYSSTKHVLDNLICFMDEECIVVFDELVNYPGFDGDNGELKAFYEFVTEHNIRFEWIGMNGVIGDEGKTHENVAVRIRINN